MVRDEKRPPKIRDTIIFIPKNHSLLAQFSQTLISLAQTRLPRAELLVRGRELLLPTGPDTQKQNESSVYARDPSVGLSAPRVWRWGKTCYHPLMSGNLHFILLSSHCQKQNPHWALIGAVFANYFIQLTPLHVCVCVCVGRMMTDVPFLSLAHH